MEVMDQSRENLLPKLGATSYTIDREAIEAMPQGDNTPIDKVILQMPGVSYDSAVANPNFHVRNEFSGVQYRINGVLLPEGVSGLGPVIDTNFVSSVSLLTGALPAQYGLRTAGVIDITSRTFSVPAGSVSYYGGSRDTTTPSFDFGGSAGNTQYFVTARGNWNSLGIENPTDRLNAIHDHTDQGKFFGYTSTLLDDSTRFSLMSGYSYSKFQIPNNPGQTALGDFGPLVYDSRALNENDYDKYAFQLAALQTKGEQIDTQLAGYFRYTNVHFAPDIFGDLVFNDVASDVTRESSLGGVQFDSAYRVNPIHTLRAGFGVSAEQTNVTNTSFVLPVDPNSGAIAPTPFPITDAKSLLGWNVGGYVQDEWKLSSKVTLNLGLRFDQLYQFVEANQVSPRAALVVKPAEGTTFHAGYARYFTPPYQSQGTQSNLALFVNTTNQPEILANSPVLPERASYFDVGVDQKVLPGLDVGVDFYYKIAKDMLDDGQFGQAVVLTNFNWAQAYGEGAEFKVKYQNGNFRAYANLAYGNMRATGPISNQYLLDAATYTYLLNNYHFTDDMQQLTGSAGASYRWDQTLFTANMIYGSGLRSEFANFDHGAPYATVNLGISHEFQAAPGAAPLTARFDIVNLLDQAYELRNGTGIGVFAPQFGARRGYYFGLSQKFGPGATANKQGSPTTSSAYRTPGSAPAGHVQSTISKDPIETVWTWTGLYMGVNVGYSASKFHSDALFSDSSLGTPLFATSSSTRHYGALGGGQAGYNWQAGIWLAGVEADIAFAHQRITTAPACPGAICNPAIVDFDAPEMVVHEHNLDWFGTLRGRLGATITPDMLVYATGGLAYGVIEHLGQINGFANGFDAQGNPTVVSAASDFVDRAMKVGWTVGGGFEAHLGGPWTAKIEYLHLDFGGEATTETNPQNSTPTAVTFNSRIREDIVRLGLNYKFDPYEAYAPADKAASPYKPHRNDKVWVALPWTWAGLYAGFNVGYGYGSSASDMLLSDASTGNPLLSTGTASSKPRSAIFGGQAGYNVLAGNWLAGVEFDFQGTNQAGSRTATCPGVVCNPAITNSDAPVNVTLEQRLEWFSTLRARLGAVVDPDTLGYFTGGLAIGGIKTSGALSGSSLTLTPAVDDSGNPILDENGNPIILSTVSPVASLIDALTIKLGWSAGGGIERHLGGNLTGRIEYLHLDFGKTSVDAASLLLNSTPVTLTYNHRVTDDIVRLGLNYKFDPYEAYAPADKAASPYKPHRNDKVWVALPWTWAGFYLGANFGYGMGKVRTDALFTDSTGADLFEANSSDTANGVLGGAQSGANWQVGYWVGGIETDVQFVDRGVSPPFVCPATCNSFGPVVAALDQSFKMEWFATLRARFGAAVTPDLLLYVTGGLAFAEFLPAGTGMSFDSNGNAANIPFDTVHAKGGWAAGAGIEAHLGGSWTAKVEYLHLDFGTVSSPTINDRGSPLINTDFNARIAEDIVRAGLNYKFDLTAAVVAGF
jgi:opacity protein-like surface antigen/outer membrane receptor protein involved in Fe transport